MWDSRIVFGAANAAPARNSIATAMAVTRNTRFPRIVPSPSLFWSIDSLPPRLSAVFQKYGDI
jgi:hypothetical protein